MLAHVRRLSTLSHPNLLPILGARIEGDRLWVYSEYDDGQSLAALLARTALTAPQSVAIGIAVVAGLEALQRGGFAHGSLDTTTVQVASYGQVRLSDYGMRPLAVGDKASTWPDPRRDVSAAGRVICAALGIDPERGADGGPSVVERTLPGLAATALTIASGSAGRSAATAAMMLSDGAGRLASRSRVYLSIAELGRLAQAGRPTIEAAIDSVMAPNQAPVIPPMPPPAPALKPVPSAPSVERPRAKPSPPAAARAASSRVPLTLALRRLAQATVPAATIAAAPPAAATPARRPENQAAPRLKEPAPAPLVRPIMPAPGPHRTARATRYLPYLLAAGGLLLLVVLVGPMLVRGVSHPVARPSSALTRPAAPAATPVDVAPTPAPSPAPSKPGPAVAAAPGLPQGTVTSFFDLVLQRRYEEAAALWSPRMKANYPPFTNINERFAGSTVLTVNQAQLTSSSDGVAVVAVDLTEVADGVVHHWLGTWRLVDIGGRWLLDQPDFQPA